MYNIYYSVVKHLDTVNVEYVIMSLHLNYSSATILGCCAKHTIGWLLHNFLHNVTPFLILWEDNAVLFFTLLG